MTQDYNGISMVVKDADGRFFTTSAFFQLPPPLLFFVSSVFLWLFILRFFIKRTLRSLTPFVPPALLFYFPLYLVEFPFFTPLGSSVAPTVLASIFLYYEHQLLLSEHN